nr:MAG TPA: hypothetical protein [Caudoviricetes sp.]
MLLIFFDFLLQADIYPDHYDLGTIFFINSYYLLDTRVIKLNFREFSRARDSGSYPSKSLSAIWR